ncbi:hypothetical protein ACFFP0_03595 [Rhizobium puerariae]|uniref:Uncharacterized protein n=1 Tax=Rhizobium puerariae TaxID=1585791 RepID=A0ABV6ABC8_9HYPH
MNNVRLPIDDSLGPDPAHPDVRFTGRAGVFEAWAALILRLALAAPPCLMTCRLKILPPGTVLSRG